MPLSDGLRRPERALEPEPSFPLELALCGNCSLAQILETVDPALLFNSEYPYYSSYSDTLLDHSRAHAADLIASRRLNDSSLVVEVASNDGYMLRNFLERGIPVLGIDPAPGPASTAAGLGIRTIPDFFTEELGRSLAGEGVRADVIIANNVLAHVADTNGFVRGLAAILAPDGVLSVEVPYLGDLVRGCAFDTIYHEHLCYFSLTSLDALFRRHGLFLRRVARLPIHGGTLRVYVGREDEPGDDVLALLEEERSSGLTQPAFFDAFAARVESAVGRLAGLLGELRSAGKTIAAYGAAAKGAILLNYAGIGPEIIDFVVDRNPHKQGWLMPGVDIPILDPAELRVRSPDYLLILPWNLEAEILAQQEGYRRAGGRFIVPIPEPRVV